MLDQEFCEDLEYRLTIAFRNSNDKSLMGFWCDGIMLPHANDETHKNINNKREVATTAFIGKDGQDRYTLILKFGNESLSRNSRNLSVSDCIPNADDKNWYSIDTIEKTLTVYLR